MEPVTLLTTVGNALAKAVVGPGVSALARELGLSSAADVADRLSAVESAIERAISQPHRENLRRGIVLLRESGYQTDVQERARRLRVAEDALVVAATDDQLDFDERAVASMLVAISAADRGAYDDTRRWLWSCNGLLCAYVDERLYYQKSILAETAPQFVREELQRQEKNKSKVIRALVGHTPNTAGLRESLRRQAQNALAVWRETRGNLSRAEPDLYFPVPWIGDGSGRYAPGLLSDDKGGDLFVGFEMPLDTRTVGGATILHVVSVSVVGSDVTVAGSLASKGGVPRFRAPATGFPLLSQSAMKQLVRPNQRSSHMEWYYSESLYSSPGMVVNSDSLAVLRGGSGGDSTFQSTCKIDRVFRHLAFCVDECTYVYGLN